MSPSLDAQVRKHHRSRTCARGNCRTLGTVPNLDVLDLGGLPRCVPRVWVLDGFDTDKLQLNRLDLRRRLHDSHFSREGEVDGAELVEEAPSNVEGGDVGDRSRLHILEALGRDVKRFWLSLLLGNFWNLNDEFHGT